MFLWYQTQTIYRPVNCMMTIVYTLQVANMQIRHVETKLRNVDPDEFFTHLLDPICICVRYMEYDITAKTAQLNSLTVEGAICLGDFELLLQYIYISSATPSSVLFNHQYFIGTRQKYFRIISSYIYSRYLFSVACHRFIIRIIQHAYKLKTFFHSYDPYKAFFQITANLYKF